MLTPLIGGGGLWQQGVNVDIFGWGGGLGCRGLMQIPFHWKKRNWRAGG